MNFGADEDRYERLNGVRIEKRAMGVANACGEEGRMRLRLPEADIHALHDRMEPDLLLDGFTVDVALGARDGESASADFHCQESGKTAPFCDSDAVAPVDVVGIAGGEAHPDEGAIALHAPGEAEDMRACEDCVVRLPDLIRSARSIEGGCPA